MSNSQKPRRRGRPPVDKPKPPAERTRDYRARRRARTGQLSQIIKEDIGMSIKDLLLPPAQGWLNHQPSRLVGLVRFVDHRPWGELDEIAAVFGAADRSPVTLSFCADRPGVEVAAHTEMPTYQFRQAQSGCISIMCVLGQPFRAGWWWVDFAEDDEGVLHATSRTRPLSDLQARALTAHPHPEEVA